MISKLPAPADNMSIFYTIGARHSKSRTEIVWKMSHLIDSLSIHFRINMPFSIFFYGNILPMKTIVLDLSKNPLSSLIINECKNYHIVLFSCFKPYYFSSVTISYIPCMCIGIINTKRRSIFIVRQDDNILNCHPFQNP